MLALRIAFLHGTYHAADPSAPQAPEWPPAPDRVFQALVAGAYGGGIDPEPLRALERHLPEIAYGDALAAWGSKLFVPAAYRAKEGRVAKHDPAMVAITDPVYLVWPDLPEGLGASLGAIAAQVDYLGRAKTPVEITVAAAVPDLPHRLAPSAVGEDLLRVPHQGRLDELDAAFAAGRRAPVAAMATYAEVSNPIPASPWGELLTLRPKAEIALQRTAQLADALRTAALSVAGDTASPLLHGHDGDHAAWAVISHVGHRYARGHVLGLGLWLPRGTDETERTNCAMALMGVSHILLTGARVDVGLPDAHQQTPAGLRRVTWARPAATWASVTPVVLDRNPKGAQRIEDIIADSVEMAGYPRPVDVQVGQSGPFTGVPTARAFRPRRGGRWTHASLAFERPVRGPVLVGRERHFGMGLFRPCADLDRGAA